MAGPVTSPSFIPHDTAVTAPSKVRASRAALKDLLLLCSIVLFVTSVALAIGVFLYQQFLATQAASKLGQLQRAKSAFEPSLVQELTRLDDRMHAAQNILGTHLAPSLLFSALNLATLQTVAFSSLELEAPDTQHITVKMQGVAESVNAIALQADLFSKNGVITSPIFSNISRQSDGVHFSLSALINPGAINFSANANGVQTGAAALPLQALQQQAQQQAVQQGADAGVPSPFETGSQQGAAPTGDLPQGQ